MTSNRTHDPTEPGAHEAFASSFAALTGHGPFPWQEALYEKFCRFGYGEDIPRVCDLPTGLGKTAVIPIWLLALARSCVLSEEVERRLPRRLVYVVNRRTVVDQATDEAARIRSALGSSPVLRCLAERLCSLASEPSDIPFALTTLRGEFADNAEWRDDPARPAVIVGTVDMIGSRLLFSGYGRGYKSRPLHAGFLGQETLLVHDEAHLEPAFQELICRIEDEQRRCREFRCFHVMALSATARGQDDAFGLTEAEGRPGSVPADQTSSALTEVWRRITARKKLRFHPVDDEKRIPDEIAELASAYQKSSNAILVFLRTVTGVEKVAAKLTRAGQQVQTLTGTMRGLERDRLVKEDPVFARFMPNPPPGVTRASGTVYLVCTSAGEVGVNISADHLVCDLTPFDSMAQRLGRVNRFGVGDARVGVIHEAERNSKNKDDPYDQARWRTLELLQTLPATEEGHRDVSPVALANLPAVDRQAAFTPPPVILAATDILFDAWALTSVRERLPGRPPVANWLHGVSDEPPQTSVAWREEVGVLTGKILARCNPAELLEAFTIKPHEVLRDRTQRVQQELVKIAARFPTSRAWLIEPDGRVCTPPPTIAELASKDSTQDVANCTILLAPEVGGLSRTGTLDGNAPFTEARAELYDVADLWTDEEGLVRRQRVWDEEEKPAGMRLVQSLDTWPDSEDGSPPAEPGTTRRYWHWYVRPRSADDDGSLYASTPQELNPHLAAVAHAADRLAVKLALPENEAAAVRFAAKWHDRGKARQVWQRSMGNGDYPAVTLAKSAGRMRYLDLGGYRHEFGSLVDAQKDPEFARLTVDARDLALHLIAAHHGRARPHFTIGEALDPERAEIETAELAIEVPRRFARLQRRYGRWGLAYLESLVRAADILASRTGPGAAPPIELQSVATVTPEAFSVGQRPESTIRVRVDPTNPGQFFACCGLLELADRLWGEAEGHFMAGFFHISAPGPDVTLECVLAAAKNCRLEHASSQEPDEDCDEEADGTEAKADCIEVVSPVRLHLDWWHNKSLKTWAGSMDARQILVAMCKAITPDNADPLYQIQVVFDPQGPLPSVLPRKGRLAKRKKREPFYFDAQRGANSLAIDVGFAPDAVQMETMARPVVEALCMFGLQRCRPAPTSLVRVFDYFTWAVPLDIRLAQLATCGMLPNVSGHRFRFKNAFRTSQRKHKAFMPATPIERSLP